MHSIEASDDAYLIYIREFRVYQCQLFLQHKCTQHRPYSCFHWHFMNQRRRRPRMKDGADGAKHGKGKEKDEYNYDPDIYCDIYDEQTGICANGDSCPFVHRNAGDTERKYHPRYYKIMWCFFDTNTAGHCSRNGPHCHMAHSLSDLRIPSLEEKRSANYSKASIIRSRYLAAMLEKDRLFNDDTCWNDAKYVVEHYKTEPCKRPPRVCRQGYACPQYHNPRDRRRNPFKYSYRSTPCPNVKQSDEWNEPSLCEKGDACQLCHSRTEQQFHPDIYKTTRCHDILTSSYCPRGTFCAFAHAEDELKVNRDQNLSRTTVLMTEFVQRSRPSSEVSDNIALSSELFSSPDDRLSDQVFTSTPELHHAEPGSIIAKQSMCEKYGTSTRAGVLQRGSPSAREAEVQKQSSFSRRRAKTSFRRSSPAGPRPFDSGAAAVLQSLRLPGEFGNVQLLKSLSPEAYEESLDAARQVRSVTGRRSRRKHRTRSGGELYRESLVKTTLGKSDMMIHYLSPRQTPIKIRSLPATFVDEPGQILSPSLRPELSFLSLASLPGSGDQPFQPISSSLAPPLQFTEEEEGLAQSKNNSSLRQISLEAMISRNLENIGIEDANFLFEGEEKLSPKVLPQGYIRLASSGEASMVDISGFTGVSSCDSPTNRPPSSFLLLPLAPTSPSQLIGAMPTIPIGSEQRGSFHECERRLPSGDAVAVGEQLFHSGWQLPADQLETAGTSPSESLFGTQQTYSDLLESDKKNRLMLQRMNAEITGLKAQVARLEQQLEKALSEREDAVHRLTTFVHSDKALASGRSIWAIQPAERKATHTAQRSLDKETQTDDYCGIRLD